MMQLFPRILAVFVLLMTTSFSIQTSQASSRGVVWNFYASSDGALLSAVYTASFLGSDDVTRRVLMTANCSPGMPEPYVAAVINPPQGQALQRDTNLMVRLENGNMLFLAGSLDRLATVNAGDNKPRYGFNLPTNSPFFNSLTQAGSRFYPKVDVDPWGGGATLEIADHQRDKVRSFLATCDRFAQQNAGTNNNNQAQAQQPHLGACRAMLHGPNPWDTSRRAGYSQAISDELCSPNEASDLPARCFLYIMAGRVNWDVNGYQTGWVPENASRLCARTPVGLGTVTCFENQIRNGIAWQPASEFCREK